MGYWHSLPLFWAGVALATYLSAGKLIINWVQNYLDKKKPEHLRRKVEIVEEGLGPYALSLNDRQREWMIQEEINMRDTLGMPTLREETFYWKLLLGKMVAAFMPNRPTMSGVCCYDILANPDYEL